MAKASPITRVEKVVIEKEVKALVLEMQQDEAQALRDLLGNLALGYKKDSTFNGRLYGIWCALSIHTHRSSDESEYAVNEICKRTVGG